MIFALLALSHFHFFENIHCTAILGVYIGIIWYNPDTDLIRYRILEKQHPCIIVSFKS